MSSRYNYVCHIKFGKYDEKCNKNKLAATNYITIEHNIRQQLMLKKEDRLNSNTCIWNGCRKRFDNTFKFLTTSYKR